MSFECHIGIIGAGTMGAGIAQVAASHFGNRVYLLDMDEATVNRAIDGVRARFDRLLEKGRMTAEDHRNAVAALHPASSAKDFSKCTLIIEAIVEDLDVKTRVLRDVLEHVPATAIIATNTSSLSVTELGRAIGAPERTVGMHFFNPAPLLKLVEVIAGDDTDPEVADHVAATATDWGKVVARAADVPGFIVNHVARPYYLEAFRIIEDGFAGPATIDAALRTHAGFRMGPLELTDLIGQDVNTATSRSVWERLGHPPLLEPSALQESLAGEGRLGRKVGRGVYRYDDEAPVADVPIELRDPEFDGQAALDDFIEHAIDDPSAATPIDRYIVARILAALIVQAELACARGVATPADIDTALRYGTNYPLGPFEWRDRIGADRVAAWLDTLNAHVPGGRFAHQVA